MKCFTLFQHALALLSMLVVASASAEPIEQVCTDSAKGRIERLTEIQTLLERNLAVRTQMAKGPGMKNGADYFGSGAIRASAWGTPDAYRILVERDDCFFDVGRTGKTKDGQKYGRYWKLSPLMAGELQFDMPALKGAACRQEQDLYRAEVRMSATSGDSAVLVRSKALRTSPDLILTVLRNTGAKPLAVTIHSFAPPSDEPLSLEVDRFAGVKGDTAWSSRRSQAGAHKYRMWIGLATRVLDGEDCAYTNSADTATVSFRILPGKAATLVTAVTSTGVPRTADPADPIPVALELAAKATPASLATQEKAHQASWDDYWLRAYIAIPSQPEMERYYYGALYGLGASHRFDNSGWSPGLNGWSTYDTQSSGWAGNYTLNYNLEAIYYGVYSSNRADLDEAYFRVIKPLAEGFGVKEAKKLGYPGVVMPGGTGIDGAVVHPDLGMRTNGAEIALPLIDHWFYTYDIEFLKKVYPYFKQVADFWDAFLIKEPSGRYVIKGTPVWEGQKKHQFNCVNALAIVKRFYIGVLAASTELGVDADRRGKWQEIVDKLADFPTRQLNGKTIYCYSEDQKPEEQDQIDFSIGAGMALPLYPLFPAQLTGLGSDPQRLQRYRDTLGQCGKVWWRQPNSFVHTPVQAVRMGYDATETFAKFKLWLKRMTPNNFVIQGGGFFECVGAIEAVDSMLLQSADGVIRLFPCWDGSDAYFHQLRAVGAFLVTASLKSGKVESLTITSEKGRPCRLVNPWPDKQVKVQTADGKPVSFVEREGVLEFSTVSSGCYVLTVQ